MTSETFTQRVFGMQPAIAFQTAALKAAPVIAQEAADHVKEWADQSATFLKEVFAAKTPVKVAEIQTAHSRNVIESFSVRWKKLRELYVSVIKKAYHPVPA